MAQALRLVPAAALLAVVVGTTGCATQWPTEQEWTAVWLAERPRTLHLQVERALPQPTIRSHDYRVGERTREGAKTGADLAAQSIAAYCIGLPVVGCPVGVVLSPFAFAFGSVWGAASVKSVDRGHSLQSVQGGPALFKRSGQAVDMPQALAEDVIADAKDSRHHLVYDKGKDAEDEVLSEKDGDLRLSFQSIELFGDLGEDPRVALVLRVRADLSTAKEGWLTWSDFTYQSPAHHVSTWQADDARLFLEETDKAIRDIASEVVHKLDSFPSMMAKLRVANMRSNATASTGIAHEAPSPVALAAPTEATSEVSAHGLLAAGTSWTYDLTDGIFGRGKSRIRVRVTSADDTFVHEEVSVISGIKKPSSVSRTIAARERSFDLYRLDADRALTEFAPYLQVAEGEGALNSIGDAKGYPTSGYSGWVTRSKPPVWEQVTVPAGTFKALRFELQGRRQIPPYTSIAVQRFNIRVWYSPEVKRYVRLEHKTWLSGRRPDGDDVVELVEYRPPS